MLQTVLFGEFVDQCPPQNVLIVYSNIAWRTDLGFSVISGSYYDNDDRNLGTIALSSLGLARE